MNWVFWPTFLQLILMTSCALIMKKKYQKTSKTLNADLEIIDFSRFWQKWGIFKHFFKLEEFQTFWNIKSDGTYNFAFCLFFHFFLIYLFITRPRLRIFWQKQVIQITGSLIHNFSHEWFQRHYEGENQKWEIRTFLSLIWLKIMKSYFQSKCLQSWNVFNEDFMNFILIFLI